MVNQQNKHIQDLELSNETLQQVTNKLHKEIYNLETKHQKTKNLLIKEFKAEVKSWKKDLGIEIKEKINLET